MTTRFCGLVRHASCFRGRPLVVGVTSGLFAKRRLRKPPISPAWRTASRTSAESGTTPRVDITRDSNECGSGAPIRGCTQKGAGDAFLHARRRPAEQGSQIRLRCALPALGIHASHADVLSGGVRSYTKALRHPLRVQQRFSRRPDGRPRTSEEPRTLMDGKFRGPV